MHDSTVRALSRAGRSPSSSEEPRTSHLGDNALNQFEGNHRETRMRLAGRLARFSRRGPGLRRDRRHRVPAGYR